MQATTQQKPPVEQAEGDEKEVGGEGDSLTPEQMRQALEAQGRRIEQLEQRVAETAGAPASQAKPDEGTAEEASDEEKEDDPDMKPDQKQEEKKEVEQAAPAAQPFDMDAFAAKLGPVIEQAVTKQLDARGIKPVEQAQPGAQPAAITRTPQPAAAPAANAGTNTLEARLIEAAESGNPAAFREAWAEAHSQRVAARGA